MFPRPTLKVESQKCVTSRLTECQPFHIINFCTAGKWILGRMTFEALVVEAWRFVVHLGQSCYPLTFDFEKNLDSKAVLQLLNWTSQNLHRKMTTYLVSCQSCTKLAVTLVFLAAGWGVSMIYFPFGSLVCSFFFRCFFLNSKAFSGPKVDAALQRVSGKLQLWVTKMMIMSSEWAVPLNIQQNHLECPTPLGWGVSCGRQSFREGDRMNGVPF